MGFVRKGTLILVCNLFLISILIGNLLLMVSISLRYENIKEKLTSATSDLIKDPVKNYVVEACKNNSVFTFNQEDLDIVPYLSSYDISSYLSDFNESVSVTSFNVSCDVIEDEMDRIIEQSVDNAIRQVYYKDYNCDFWDCLKTESIFFLLSEKSMEYWRAKFRLSLMISIALFVLIFLLVKKKPNSLILVGSLLIISALPFAKLDWLASLALGRYGISASFLSGFSRFFFKILTGGIILLGAGIVLRLFGITLRIFSKDSKTGKDTKLKKLKGVKKKDLKNKTKNV